MSKVISFTNQKGGVGKTTTAVNLAACLAEAEQRVLLFDMDPQGNASSGLIQDETKPAHTSYELLCGQVTAENCIINALPGLDLIAADINLSGAVVEFQDLEDKYTRLKDAIADIKDNYDYILIDCPPSLGILTINALAASDSVILPVQCEYYAMEGLGQMLNTISLIQNDINPDLEIEGILFTMYDQRTNLSQQVVESVKGALDLRFFDAVIPRNIKLAEAPSFGQPIIVYDSASRGAESYRLLAAEILND
ncbi:MAG: AAA family ATPase [Eubacteriales bacterium]|nr:AAA family ATPase [Eubacteriales bacterium]